MRGIPCEDLERLYAGGTPICPRCIEAYKAGSRLFVLHLLRSFRSSGYDKEYHVAPTLFFMDRVFQMLIIKPAPAALCGVTTTGDWYGKYWAASRFLSMTPIISRLLILHPVLDGVPWSEEVFHQHGIDLGSELALLVLSQVDLQAPEGDCP